MQKQLSTKARSWLVAGIVILCLLLDQWLKIYIKLHFTLGEMVEVFPWFQICFVENNGMAFGIEWFDKLFLTLFRLGVAGVLGYYLYRLTHSEVRVGYLVMIALVMAGALGNIIDCMFYGLMFSESTPWEVATLFPEEGGYAGFFYGKVVDMFYFPLIRNAAGEVLFFRPVFNIADSCITVAVILVLLFYNKDLQTTLQQPKPAE
ncbi:MAG: lipoprotein signal peptidase [Bacteroidales bacterium]|nr:lipoprotein signal peptidase [Bacteroidales bacterium]